MPASIPAHHSREGYRNCSNLFTGWNGDFPNNLRRGIWVSLLEVADFNRPVRSLYFRSGPGIPRNRRRGQAQIGVIGGRLPSADLNFKGGRGDSLMPASGTAAGTRKFSTVGKGELTFIAERRLDDQPLRRPHTLRHMLQMSEDLFLRCAQELRKIARGHHSALQFGHDLMAKGLGGRTAGRGKVSTRHRTNSEGEEGVMACGFPSRKPWA